MQFSENWLRQFVDPDLDSAALAHVLTMAGLEVEEVAAVAPDFSQVVVGEIVGAERHPDADRLQLCRVDVGQAEPLQIVCGAPNARVGLKVPCALVGATLPGLRIKQARVRGVESFGMLCSSRELGLSDAHEGLLELAASAPVGQSVRDWLDLDDRIFTLKLTPNRSDCLSVVGVARDLAALTGAALRLPAIGAVAATTDDRKTVHVEAAQACPRYSGRLLRGVDATARTPDWMLRRLERGGLHGISAVVDVTNYVLLELGQPLHAFDADRVRGDIRVRHAVAGERLELLNAQTVALDADMLVIADDSGAIALAGIMGGAATAVDAATTTLFLESAFFAPAAITGRARRLNFSTDAAYRFERGVDFGNTRAALDYATALILDICGGEAGEITEVCGTLPQRAPVELRLAQLNGVLGITLRPDEVAALLRRLAFDFQQRAEDFVVTPPSHRFDIAIEADLIEEVARLHGYDRIPASAPHAALTMLPAPEGTSGREVLQALLAQRGYQETINYSFVDAGWEHELLGNATPVAIKNPIASNMSVMRSGLWGGLLDALVYNLNRRQERVFLFETGAVYGHAPQGFVETTRIAGLAYGAAAPEQWAQDTREVDFYDVKADVERLTRGRARYVAATHPALHPGQSARVLLDDQPIGWLGTLHPKWQQHYQLPRAAILFELDVAPLLARSLVQYSEVGKFPPVRRDLAVLVDESVTAQALLDTLRAVDLPVTARVELFDLYRGEGIAKGKKSLAFLVLMQDTQKTLTDASVDGIVAALLDSIAKKYGAVLR